MDNNETNRTIMNIRIDRDLKKEFRIKTIEEGTTMSEIIMSYIREYLKK